MKLALLVTSFPVTLILLVSQARALQPPVITQQPGSANLNSGDSISLWVGATGEALPLEYQWSKDGVDIPDATGDYLGVLLAEDFHTGIYRVRVSDGAGSTLSDPAIIIVDGTPIVGEAADAEQLPWLTVDDCDASRPGWRAQRTESHDGVDALRAFIDPSDGCGKIVETQVNGPAAVTFWWKLQGADSDALAAQVIDANENVVAELDRVGSDGDGWVQQSLDLASGKHRIRWQLSAAGEGSGPIAWLDEVAVNSLGEAVDAPELIWDTGTPEVQFPDEAGWSPQTLISSDGIDAAQSPPLGNYGTSEIRTTVQGPAVLRFDWSLQGRADHNGVIYNGAHLYLRLDGDNFGRISHLPGNDGTVPFTTVHVPIPPGTHTVTWRVEAGDQSDGQPTTTWLDQVSVLPFDNSLSRALDQPDLAFVGPGWTEDGTFVQFGSSSAMSPQPAPDETSPALTAIVEGPAEITFDWLVSDPLQTGDRIEFHIDDQLQNQRSGNIGGGWEPVSSMLGPGFHVLSWTYHRDSFSTEELDGGFIDHLRIGSTGNYLSWIASKGLAGPDAAADADPDGDGIGNALEFVLGGEPNPDHPDSNSQAVLPTASHAPDGSLVFTFQRKDISEEATTLTFQWSTDLTFPAANDVPVGPASSSTDGVEVVVTEDIPDIETDTIVITVPASRAVGGALFVRLSAAIP